MDLDLYISKANLKKVLFLKQGEVLKDFVFPDDLDNDYREVIFFKTLLNLSNADNNRIGLSSSQIKNILIQLDAKGFALIDFSNE